MKAKPGRAKAGMELAKVDYQPPAPPGKMTEFQRIEWGEITSSPLLSHADGSLLVDYYNHMILRDKALNDIHENGLTVPGAKGDLKTNVCWKIYRDCGDHLLELRRLFMLTPRDRAELRAAGLLAPVDPEDSIETD
jgi:phage terminase small subunit